MTREEAIKYGIEWLKDEHLDAKDEAFIKIALEALEQEPITTTAGEGGVMYYPQVEGVTPTVVSTGKQVPCDDAISREDALMCLTGEIKETDTIETIIARFGRRIRKLSSVNPQPKTDWIPVSKESPKTEQYAYITVHNQTKMCWYQNGVFVDSEQNAYTKENEELVAWMPFQIPKPYKAGSEVQNAGSN